jgi:DUF177 domain-containing protein
MLLRISDLQLGKVRFSETFAPGTVDLPELQVRQTAPLVVSGFAELSQATMEIRVSGHLATRMEITCDRCLETAPLSLDTDFGQLYRPASSSPEHGEVALVQVESEVGFYQGEGLELTDVVREEVVLQLPMQRVCREDCKGICPVCGQNRNQVECHCHQEPVDDRWAGLRNL